MGISVKHSVHWLVNSLLFTLALMMNQVSPDERGSPAFSTSSRSPKQKSTEVGANSASASIPSPLGDLRAMALPASSISSLFGDVGYVSVDSGVSPEIAQALGLSKDRASAIALLCQQEASSFFSRYPPQNYIGNGSPGESECLVIHVPQSERNSMIARFSKEFQRFLPADDSKLLALMAANSILYPEGQQVTVFKSRIDGDERITQWYMDTSNGLVAGPTTRAPIASDHFLHKK